MSEFVDSNIFIRLITADDPARMARCLDLFKRAERGDIQLVTSESIVGEAIYVLSSPVTYRMDREDIATRLRPILELKGLRIDHKRAILLALDRYEQTRLDFEDCVVVAHTIRMELNGIYSYDRGFDRVSGVQRIEP
ncbi:MAG: PIN domain-containing protein [Thermomicrobiales bacterium]